MKKLKMRVASLMAALLCALGANAEGWPANYEGVMLQGFYWDCFKVNDPENTVYPEGWGWKALTQNAEEICQYFDLMWLPNPAESEGGLGYHPRYWFSHFNTALGSESEFYTMLEAYKSHGMGLIAEMVLNHRTGVTNWTDFPTETWRGQQWHIGVDGICCTDEVKDQPGQATPTGAADTGENWSGCRDLDHTNTNVQNNIIAYERFMLEDLGYVGFRFDYGKGFHPRYIKQYNQASQPTFSVGEYWDNYDNIVWWIDNTGKESGAFDFPAKWAINDAFRYNDMTNLVWKANGNNNQPVGLMHYNYRQYAVTFVDNHDTYHEDYKFPDRPRVEAAYAFILCSPGTPCVLVADWLNHKEALKKLIAARKKAGISNTSTVTVLRTDNSCYMAELVGSKGTLAVKIGPAMVSPNGYSESDIQASGNDYCVWVKTNEPNALYLQGTLPSGHWVTTNGVEMTKNGSVFTANNVEIQKASTDDYGLFNFATKLGSSWDVVNSSDRYGAAEECTPASTTEPNAVTRYAVGVNSASCKSWKVAPGVYNVTVNFENMTMTLTKVGDVEPDPDPDPEPEPATNTYQVFFEKPDNWSEVCSHVWGGNLDPAPGGWPGKKMTQYSGKIYTVTYTGTEQPDYIIFNNNDKGQQTVNLTFNNEKLYTLGDKNSEGKYNATSVAYPEYKVHYDNALTSWGNVYAYLWENAGEKPVVAWPGMLMQAAPQGALAAEGENEGEGEDEEESQLSATHTLAFRSTFTPTHVIFHNNDGTQTADIEYSNGETYAFQAVMPSQLYVIGTLEDNIWETSSPYALTKKGNNFEAEGVMIAPDTRENKNNKDAYFTLISSKGNTWADVNQHERIGAVTQNAAITLCQPIAFRYFTGDETASAYNWKLTCDPVSKYGYSLVVDFLNQTLTVTETDGTMGIEQIGVGVDAPVEFYTIMGVKVNNPGPGLYIMRQGTRVSKVLIR